jgi:ABC-2 type transport system ATP-binding protein
MSAATSTTTAPPIDARNVTKRYGDVAAVVDLTFALVPGTITGFLGPNGAGKSTTLRMVGGLLRPTSGEIRLFGRDARDPRAREPLGYMPADPVFLPHLTGAVNLDLLARLRRADDIRMRQTAAAALSLSSGDLERRVGGYSSGMRQKLAIIAAVQHRPDLVVLDEPANRLDPLAHHSFCDLLRDMARDGHTVFLSSHVLAEVEAVCDSVLLVREGALLRSATVAELRENAPRVVTVTRADGSTAVTRVAAERPDLLRELLGDPDIVDLTVVPASLEDVVLALYTGEGQS